MSIPPYTPPGGYVPPSAQFGQQRSGPSCWLWGLCTCLVVVIIVCVVAGTAIYNYSKSSGGKKFFSSMHTALGETSKLGPALTKLHAVHDAIIRYHERNGTYPATLKALLPDYLASASDLHTDFDTNHDPTHVSFAYTQPAANAPGSTQLLSFHWTYTIDIGVQKQDIDTEVDMMIDGSTNQTETQTMTMESQPGAPPGAAPPPPVSFKTTTHTSPDGKTSVSTSSPFPAVPASP
jgi:hypothetical protein